MKKHTLKFILVLVLFIPGLSISNAQADETAIQSLIDNYGMDALIEVIIDKRFGEITIEKNGDFVSAFGKPNKSHINTKTILRDIDNIGIDVAKFTELVEKHVEKKLGKKARLKKEVVTPSSKPTGTKSSSVTVRYGDADPTCMKACKKKLESCSAKVNEDYKKCKATSDIQKCLKNSDKDAMQCSNKLSSCEDNCFEKVIKK